MQFVETISSKQTELDTFIAEGYKTALSEERRRYCFLVDRQCAVAKNSSAYHGKVRVTLFFLIKFHLMKLCTESVLIRYKYLFVVIFIELRVACFHHSEIQI